VTAADRLRQAIDEADRAGLAGLLAPLDEAARAGLAPIARSAFAESRRRRDGPMYGHLSDAGDLADAQRWLERMICSALAWLGTGDITEFPPQGTHSYPQWCERFDFQRAFDASELHRILLDRRPSWLPDLAAQYVTGYHWDSAWRLVIEGALPRPADESYLRGLADHGAWWPEPGLADMVLRDPALLHVDLPALLELPDGLSRIVSRDMQAGTGTGRRTWLPVLNENFPPGHPIREQILDRLLDLLSGDLGGQEAARLHQFLGALTPTPDELRVRRRALFALAAQRIPGVVSYAIRVLARLSRANLIPPAELVEAVEPALLAPAKATATTALAIVTVAVRRDPRLRQRALTSFVMAVTHPHPEVQVAAIEAAAPHLAACPDIAAQFAGLLPELSASAAQRLRAELPQHPADERAAPAVDLDDLIRRAAKLPAEVSRAVGLDEAVAAVCRGSEPAAVPVRPAAAANCARIAPVSGVDELIEVLLRLADGQGGVVDIERALDGLATIGPRWPQDFGRRAGPLVARVNRRFARDAPDWGEQPSGDICLLVASWIQPERGTGPAHLATTPYTWLTERIREVALGLGDPAAGPLLALPTDQHGWLDPAVLVRRAGAAGGAVSRPVDTAVALARLTPSGRAEALSSARGLPGPLGRAIRAALGGGDDLSGLPDIVVGVIGWLRGAAHEGPPYLFGAVERDEAPRRSSSELAIEVNKQQPRVVEVDGVRTMDWSHLPAYQEMRAAYRYERGKTYAPDWAATLWPSDHRWLWREDVTAVPVLRLLLNPDEPVPTEALVATIRLAGRGKPAERTLAADVIIHAIGDARVTSAELARALRAICGDAAVISSARLVMLLRETASGSALHTAVVRAALAAALPAWLGRPLAGQQMYAPVALLDELCATDGTALTDPAARALLGRLTSSRSKTAAIAGRLLGRRPTAGCANPDAAAWPAGALAIALTARLERAERWRG
jgi:hypothetical protein